MVNSLYPPNVRGGAETSVRLLAEALVTAGHEVVVVSTSGNRHTHAAVHAGVRAIYLPIANLFWPFDGRRHGFAARKAWHLLDLYNPSRALRRLIAAELPDVVHTNNLQGFSVSAWRAAAAEQTPVLHTLRDYYLACGRCVRFRNGSPCARTCGPCRPIAEIRRAASASVAGVVGTSRFILDRHTQLGFFGHARIRRTIHNPADPDASPVSRPDRSQRLRLGYLGRLEPIKGVVQFAETLLRAPDCGAELLIAGTGSELQRLQRIAARSGDRIRVLGWKPKGEILGAIDALVVPSLWHEPLARSAIDAIAAGIPILASDRGGMPELVRNGENGLLFDPQRPESVLTAIQQLRGDSTVVESFASRGGAAVAGFRADRVAALYLEVYDVVRRI